MGSGERPPALGESAAEKKVSWVTLVPVTLLVPVAVFFVFVPVVGIGFAQDDYSLLLRAQQATVRSLLGCVVNLDVSGFYRPQLGIYFALLYRVFGLCSTAFQLANGGLLTVNGWLVFQLSRRVGLGLGASLVAALFYSGNTALMTPVMWTAAASAVDTW